MEPGMLSLSKIEELPRNAKAHDLGAIHQSYDRFSFIERLIINNTTGHLIAGHGRLHALKQRKQSGKEAPEGIDVQGDDWLVPVDYVNISADKEEAAAIALNRLTELGGWDEQALAEVLADLAADDLLDGTGFDGDDLDAILASMDINKFTRPDFSVLVEQMPEAHRKEGAASSKEDGNWFYIEFYGEDERFKRLTQLFVDNGLLDLKGSLHELNNDKFYELVVTALEGENTDVKPK